MDCLYLIICRPRADFLQPRRSDYPGMVHWASNWIDFLSLAGDAPGSQAGDVVIELGTPVAGMDAIRCDTSAITAQVDAGQIIGLTLTLDDGRRLLVPWSNVTGIIDASAGGS